MTATSGWRLETRRSPALIALPVLVAVALLAALRSLLPGISSWLNASTSIVASVQLLGPLAAGLAAYSAGRERRRGATYLRTLSVRPGSVVLLAECSGVAFWAATTYVLLSVALIVKTALGGARPGFISVWWVAVGGLGLLLHVVGGYALGRVVPRRAAAPVVAVLFFVAGAAALRSRGGWTARLVPVTVQPEDVFERHNNLLFAGQFLWYLGAMLLVACLAFGRLMSRVAVTTLLVVATVLAVSGLTVFQRTHGRFYAGPAKAMFTCQQLAGPPVCVHPDYAQALPTLVPALDVLVSRLDRVGLNVGPLRQRASRPASAANGFTEFPLYDRSPGYVTLAQTAVLAQVTDAQGCYDVQAATGNSPDYQTLVQGWLFNGPVQYQAPDAALTRAITFFNALSEDGRIAWLHKHLKAFQHCRLNSRDFV